MAYRSIDMSVTPPPRQHHAPQDLRDRAAYAFVKFLRFFADTFFARRYGHRAVVLETVAAVPGMVGGSLQHLRALRRMESDHGWIRTLLDEAENERMHLMTFIQIARPSRLERLLILIVQGVFYNFFFLLYMISPRTAHRVVGYLEEEAVYSYTEYLAGSTTAATPMSRRPRWRLIIGICLQTRACVTSSSLSVQMRHSTATSITNLPTSWLIARPDSQPEFRTMATNT